MKREKKKTNETETDGHVRRLHVYMNNNNMKNIIGIIVICGDTIGYVNMKTV